MNFQYAVVGHPISHSKSPFIHNTFARERGLPENYTALLAPLDGFAATVDAFRQQGGLGCNVTVPFKLDAFAYATHVSPRAYLAGAVNCLKFVGKDVLADNYDGVGMVHDIVYNLGFSLHGKKILIVGAGGSARGIVQPLLEQAPQCLFIANRTLAKAQAIQQLFIPHAGASTLQAVRYDELGAQQFDVIINSTSAGLTGEELPLTPQVFSSKGLAYDLMYGKGLTPFLRQAKNAGVQQIADGAGLLGEQAALAFEWWRGVRPATAGVISAISVPFV